MCSAQSLYLKMWKLNIDGYKLCLPDKNFKSSIAVQFCKMKTHVHTMMCTIEENAFSLST